jgi:hypothetical protein
MFTEHLYVDHRPVDMPQFDCTKQTFDAVDNLDSTAVAECQDEDKTSVAGSLLDTFVKLFLSSNSGVFSFKNFSSKRISAMISALGRCQFSAENA